MTSSSSARIGTSEHFVWLDGIVKVVLVLNLLDAIFTLVWINLGLAREANPLFAELVTDHPVLFALAKLSLVGLASLILWRHRFQPLAVVGIFLAFAIYYALLLWHLGYLSLIIGTILFP